MSFDVAVVGGGPAGIAAAVKAAECGATVVVLDSGRRLGGQYFRRPPLGTGAAAFKHRTGSKAFDSLEQRLSHLESQGQVVILTEAHVFAIEKKASFILRARMAVGRNGSQVRNLDSKAVVIATGAYDRSLPFPGWDLPGVMTGGAAQALVKGSVSRVPGRTVVAGTGPFLVAVTNTLVEAGVDVIAVIEANSPTGLLRHLPSASVGWRKSAEVGSFLKVSAEHRIRYLTRSRVVAATGVTSLTSVRVASIDKNWVAKGPGKVIPCDTLAIGYGFVPRTELTIQLGCAHLGASAGGVRVAANPSMETSVPGVLACGETVGVGGADLALEEGIVAGSTAAIRVGRCINRDAETRRALKRIRSLRRFARALEKSFSIRPGWADDLTPETLLCRCEEVSVGDVRRSINELGATDSRSVKALTRAGMGWCQGRMCTLTVEEMCRSVGGESDLVHVDVSPHRRPLADPVHLGLIGRPDLTQVDDEL